jgi:hypothetical protein
VSFNTSDKILYPASGSVRIQVDGSSVPTVHHDQYVQIHLPPGPHHLLLEHWDMVVFTSEYDVQIQGSDQYFEVYSHPFSTQFKEVAALPADFRSRWRPAKTPETW